ncbi:hypothetical protein BH23GEM7_BH23GEM7_30710 [soil metagenome]|nr:ATP-binding protein [Gemmatimonadota bacterium]
MTPRRAKPSIVAEQLTLDYLDDVLSENPGELIKLPIAKEDIGGELIAILSQGLYTNPLDCLREYVQNAVDADAGSVTLKVTGNSVIIMDDGDGMGLDDILDARRFGLSGKWLMQHVGFRGIGIYSGFDLCRRLRITSTKRGEESANILVFEFADMRAQLNGERQAQAGDAEKTSLIDLLSEHTKIGRDPSPEPADSHYTIVELQDISDMHIALLSDRGKLRQYLLQNLPIDFTSTFPHRQEINQQLSRHVPSYHAVAITLQSDGIEDEVVSKYPDVSVQRPQFGYITSGDRQVAYYWAALTAEEEAIEPRRRPGEIAQYEGLVYKMKGFTVGGRDRLARMFSRKPQLYRWISGEVYVLDPEVIPNAARDDFETNHAKERLEVALLEAFDTQLLAEVERYQARSVASRRIEEAGVDIEQIEQELAGTAAKTRFPNNFERYSRVSTILEQLKRQKKAATHEDQKTADAIIARAKSLQRKLTGEAASPTPEATRRKRAARKPTPPIPLDLPSTSPRTIRDVLQEAGWSVDGDLGEFISLIQAALEDVLLAGGPQYRNFLSALEARIADASSAR